MIWLVHIVFCSFILGMAVKIKKENFFIYTSFIYSIIIFGQRWMTGTDFPNYLRYYLVNFRVSEPGYYYLQRFLDVNNLYFGILIFLIFLITLWNNYRFMLKFKENTIFIIFLFLLSEIFFAQLSQIRQFIAVSFFINSYFYVYNKKYFKSILNVIIAATFHTSILFVIPFLLVRIKLNRIKLLYLALVSGVLPLLDLSIVLRLPVFDRYSHYLDSVFNVDLSMFHYLKFYLLFVIIFAFLWFVDEFRYNPTEQMILNAIIFNLLLYGASFQFALFLRVSFYFKIFEIVFFMYYIKRLTNFSKQFAFASIALFFLSIYTGLAATDPYDISRYNFRPLRITDNRNRSELYQEINNFYE